MQSIRTKTDAWQPAAGTAPHRRGSRLATSRVWRRSPVLSAVVALLAGILAITAAAGPALGDDRSKLEELKARQQKVKVQLDLAIANDTAVEAEALRLQRLVGTEEALVASAQSAADAAQARVDAATARIDDLTSRGAAAHNALVSRAIDLYEHPFRNEEVLLSGVQSLDELTTRQVLANAVQARTSDLLDAVRQQRSSEVAARRDLASAQAEATARRKAAEDEVSRLQAAEASERRAHGELQTRIHDLQVENTGLAEGESALQAKLAANERQYQAQVASIASAPSGPVGPAQLGSVGSFGLQWPVHGPVTREFGYQPGGYHPGIDIAPGYGTPIAAAGDGVVIYASWESGYGNYTCIDHGRSISSCYGHQSSIGVSVGQTVRRGDIIGREGSTGNSTGPHVHFEIRVNGQVNNPRNFIPGSP